MSRQSDDLDEHLAVLVRLRRVAGAVVYGRALLAAKIAVGKVILAEAERRAGVGLRRRGATVVRFRRKSAENCGALDEER